MKTMSKFVSFVCSLAMATTAFTGIVTVNAEENTDGITQGIVLNYDEASSSSTKAVIEIKAVGIDEIASWDARLDLGADVTYTVDYEMPEGTPLTSNQSAILNGICVVNAYGTSNQIVSEVGDVLATVTLTFEQPLEDDLTVTLAPSSNIKFKTAEGTMQTLRITNSADTTTLTAATTTVLAQPSATAAATTAPTETATATTAPTEAATATVAPTATAEPVATPYVTSRPTAIPIGTPDVTVEPTEPAETTEPTETPVPITQGMVLEYDEANSTSTKAVINVRAVGVLEVASWDARFDLGSDVAFTISHTMPEGTPLTSNQSAIVNGIGVVNAYGTSNQVIATNGDLLATVTLTFDEPLNEDITAKLGVSSNIKHKTAEGTMVTLRITDDEATTTLPVATVTILANPTSVETPTDEPSATATAAPEFEADDEVKFSDILVDVPDTMDGGSLIAAVVDVTNGSSAAEYGEDFVAEYNGEQLTEDEYFNLINGYSRNGYGDGDMKDVIDNLTFLIKDGVTVTASPAYQTTEQAAENLMTVYPAYEGVYPPESTEEPEDGMVTLTVDTPSHGAITVTYTDADGNSVSLDTDDEDIEEEIPAGTSVRLRAIADNGYDFSRWGGDISGTSSPKTITVNRDTDVSATFTRTGSNSNSGGSSNSGSTGNGNSAGGGIARPNGGTGVVTPGINFTDLGSVQWAQPAINYLVSAGIINGRSNTIFDPNASVTRAEFAKMVCATFGISATPNAAQTFVDVSPSDWFYGYVQAAAANGIVNGVSETAFDPNATITREQMAAMLYRAIEATGNLAKLPAGTATVFADEAQIADYAKTYVSALNAAGVINGTSATTFEPKATATRAQAAAIIYQYLGAVGLV